MYVVSHQERRVGITLTGLTPSYVGACPKPGTGLPTSYVVVHLVLSGRWSEVIACFVDIGESVDHHCKTFFKAKHTTNVTITFRTPYYLLFTTIWGSSFSVFVFLFV
jgi:hypothetical protein